MSALFDQVLRFFASSGVLGSAAKVAVGAFISFLLTSPDVLALAPVGVAPFITIITPSIINYFNKYDIRVGVIDQTLITTED